MNGNATNAGGNATMSFNATTTAGVQDLYWQGQYSFMRALGASLVFSNKTDPRPPDNYTWDDGYGNEPSYDSGQIGEYIRRENWTERVSGSDYLRELTFAMWPKSLDQDGDINSAKSHAKTSGWSLWGTDALDNLGGKIQWRDFMMDFGDRPTLVQVPSSDKLFECDYYKQDLINADGVMGTFEAYNVLFGAFLDSGYVTVDLERYRPCEYKYGAAAYCEAIYGVVFCDGNQLTPDDIDPDTTLRPTPSPSSPGSVFIDWRSDQSYMAGQNVEATLEGETDYCFEGEYDIKIDSGSGGNRMDRTWNEECHSRKRRIFFKASSYPNNNGDGFRLDEGKMNNEKGNAVLHWSEQYGAFNESYIILPDDDSWDAWTCEHVEFNFKNEEKDKLPGKFVADNFVLGMFLEPGYEPNELKLFNPCNYSEACQDQTCKCRTVDGEVMCDSSDSSFSVNVGESETTVLDKGSNGGTSSAPSGRGFVGRTPLIITALTVGVLALL